MSPPESLHFANSLYNPVAQLSSQAAPSSGSAISSSDPAIIVFRYVRHVSGAEVWVTNYSNMQREAVLGVDRTYTTVQKTNLQGEADVGSTLSLATTGQEIRLSFRPHEILALRLTGL